MSFLLPFLLLGCAPDTFTETAPQDAYSWADEDIVPNRILVQRRDGIKDNIRFQNQRLNLLRSFERLDIQEIELPEDANMREVLQEMIDSNEYTIVEPVLLRSIPEYSMVPFTGNPNRSPNDAFYQFQPNMDIIQATDSTHTGSGIVVAVIDTGVAIGGTDTPVNMVAGYDFVNDDTNATDDQGHGTHVAGTIAQATNNSVGTIGVAPDVSIMPLKTLGSDGTGFSSDTVAALEYALNNGVDVVNLSLGAPTSSSGEEAAVDALVAAGVAVVAANGNDGIQSNGIIYPAAYANSIAVSATDHQSVITGYSNAGPQTDLAAPGGDVNADTDNDGQVDGILQETIIGGSYNFYFFEGTSMATPHVAGAIASLMSAGASAAEAQAFLKSTAIDLGATGVDDLYGSGEIRVQDAIDAYLNAQAPGGSIDSLSAGDLFITEVMHNPEMVVDYRGEWIELYNNSGAEINLNGLQIANGVNAGITVSQDVLVSAGDYVVLGVFASSVGNGGYTPDYVYTYSDLKLGKSTTLTLSNASTTLDTFAYSSSTHDTSVGGQSLSLDSLTPSDNDVASNWCVATSSYGDGDLGTPGSSNDVCLNSTEVSSLSTGDLVISEVMVDPSAVSDFRGEWFEIYNNTAETVDLNGMVVSCGGNAGFTVSGSTLVNAGSNALLSVKANSGTNGGMSNVDIEYSYTSCSFAYTDSLSIGVGGTTFDSVTWTSDYPFSSGSSMTLGTLDASSNDFAGAWCASNSSYGNGDIGTPGTSNDACPTSTALSSLSTGDLVISEVMVDPSAVSDFRGEWFEIYNNTAETVDLNGMVVSCGGNAGFTVSGSTLVNAGSNALLSVKANSGTNGGMSNVDIEYSYTSCSFAYTDSLSIGVGGTTFDSVTWTSDYPFSSGSSMTLGTLDASSNDSMVNWCAASSSYGAGDSGTPGDVNDTCPDPGMGVDSLGAGDLVISEIMSNPVTVFDYRGEWFEVYNNSGFTVNLNGLVVNSSNNAGFTVSESLLVDDGDYILFGANASSSTNGGLPSIDIAYSYGDLSFGRRDDITISSSTTTIDSVTITSAYPDGVGASLSLDTLSASANDQASNWCESTTGYGSGESGTPGVANDSCQ